MPIFHFVQNIIWGCSKWVQIALFASWNSFDFQCLFLIGCLISHIFYNPGSICFLKVAGVAPYGFWTQIRIIVSSTFVRDLNWAASATFRPQIEQILTHFEQSQIRFRTKWKIWTLCEPMHKNFKCLLKIEVSLKNFLLSSVSCPYQALWNNTTFMRF